MIKSPCYDCKYKSKPKTTFKPCIDCEKKYAYSKQIANIDPIPVRKIKMENQKVKSKPKIPTGFEKYSPRSGDNDKQIVRINQTRINITKKSFELVNGFNRVDLFFNRKTRQIGILPCNDGLLKITKSPKLGFHYILAKVFLNHYKIPPCTSKIRLEEDGFIMSEPIKETEEPIKETDSPVQGRAQKKKRHRR